MSCNTCPDGHDHHHELVHAAVIDYETGTGKLEKALKALEG